jgi:hypothetical protein
LEADLSSSARAASLFVVLLPAFFAVLPKLANDRRLMGEHVNGWGTNAVLFLLATVAPLLDLSERTGAVGKVYRNGLMVIASGFSCARQNRYDRGLQGF